MARSPQSDTVAIATILATGSATAFASGNPGLGTSFALATAVAIALAFASQIRWLHRLPLVGATPVPDVEFGLENEFNTVIDYPHEGTVILRVGVANHQRWEIDRVLVNAWITSSTSITRCDPRGTDYTRTQGDWLLGEGGVPYWTESGLTLPAGSFIFYFRVVLPAPGDYRAVFVLSSPEFYGSGTNRDKRHEHTITLLPRGRPQPSSE